MAFSYREIMDRRNERDRKLSAKKRHRRQEMREEVAQLETQKRMLESRFEHVDTLSSEDEPESTDTSLDGSPKARQQARQRYLSAVRRVEELRNEKTSLLAELSWRELVRNAVQVSVDEANLEQEQERSIRRQLLQVAAMDQGPIMSDLQAIVLREKLCAQVEALLTRLKSMQRLTEIEVFGWSDLRLSDSGNFIDLAVTKRFYHDTADALWLKTWQNSTSGHDLRIFCRGFFDNEPEFEFHGPNFAATRGPNVAENLNDDGVGMIVVRTRNLQGGGGGCVLIAELNPNAVASDLAKETPFRRPMYWLFKDVPGDEMHPGYALAQFGTTVPAACYEITRVIISELIFSVVRWETLGVHSNLLQWGETTDNVVDKADGDPRMFRDPRYRSHAAPTPTEVETVSWEQAQEVVVNNSFEPVMTMDMGMQQVPGRPWEQVPPTYWMQ